jgi:hypothetical protein
MRYPPYYADDTDGVHFEVESDGTYVQAHLGRTVMIVHYQLKPEFRDWVSVYHAHKEELDACVSRRVRKEGRDTVILLLNDLRTETGQR